MLEHCELVNIRVIEFSARRMESNEPTEANVTSEISYYVDDSTFANKYLWRAELVDEERVAVAELTATLLVEYEVTHGFVPDQHAAEEISETTGYFAAYPYVRELFQTHTARLQFNPLILGMLPHDATNPEAAAR
jgi:hypothetical protein